MEEEEKSAAATSGNTGSSAVNTNASTQSTGRPTSAPRSINSSTAMSSGLSMSLGSASGTPLNSSIFLHEPSLLNSPQLFSSSFTDMLKQNNNSSFGLGHADMFLSTGTPLAPRMNTQATSSNMNSGMKPPVASSALFSQQTSFPQPPQQMESAVAKDTDALMDLSSFSLEATTPTSGQPTANTPTTTLASKPAKVPTLNNNFSGRAQAVPAPVRTPKTSRPASASSTRSTIHENEDDDDDDDEEDEKMDAKSATNQFGSKRPFDVMSNCSMDSCSTIATAPEDDRGFRKKSREKMRRQEVNVKFDELIELLGLSNRVRKSAILQEAVSAIKTLRRERDDMRRERDRLQQEVSKLATCLQYTHLGSVAAANAVAMSTQGSHMPNLNQANPAASSLAHLHPHQQAANAAAAAAAAAALSSVAHHHPLNVPCAPGGACFPIGSTFGALGPPLASAPQGTPGTTSAASISNATPIAPKLDRSPSTSRLKS
ncbi:hypothetical protein PINS_up001227 [Pythium insidiosum]|nr:hypothetical protein PINS_up001227 [Pythium insidiosum]